MLFTCFNQRYTNNLTHPAQLCVVTGGSNQRYTNNLTLPSQLCAVT